PNHAHHVVALKDVEPFGSHIRALGVPVDGLEMSAGPALVSGGARFAQLLARVRPQVIHSWLYHADLFAGLAGRVSGIPVLWHVHVSDLDPSGVKRTTRWVAKQCAALSAVLPRRIIACSRATERVHRALGYKGMEVVSNGVDTERFRPRPRDRSTLGLSREHFLVGIIARFDLQKDLTTFLDAAARLHSRLPNARFLLAGAGMDEHNATLATWIRARQLEDVTLRLGFRDDVECLYPMLDVFSLSSRSEALPMSLLEAMASETLSVVTDTGDNASVLGSLGWVVPPRAPEALCHAWLEASERSELERKRLGAAARQRVLDRYSAREHARRFAGIYSELAAQGL
ncbi:MAG: glycosyltransferase, partial [Myxococcota bacterium]